MNKLKKIVSLLLVVSMIISLTACAGGTPDGDSNGEGGKALFTPGTYEGEAEGYGGVIKANVTVTETEISDIDVEHTETPGLGDKAVEEIIEMVQKNTTLNVEIISGATYSSYGVLEAIALALNKAGADIESLKTKEMEDEEIIGDIEKTADVIVVGGGGAGLAAAVSAHEKGASVIVIEKMPLIGGSTIISGSAYNAADQARQSSITMTENEINTVEEIISAEQTDPVVQEWQETLNKEWEEYKTSDDTGLFDSPSLHKLQTYEGGDKVGYPSLISVLADNSLKAIEWLEDLGMEFTDHVFTVLGGLWSRAHKPVKPLGTGYIETYMDYIEDNKEDIEVMVETTAMDFIVEDDVVKGVNAQGEGGKVTLHAEKGVVLATGGFGANVEMREQYNTLWPSLENVKTTNQTGATGDGIIMAQDLDASIIGMEDIQLLPMGDPRTGSLSGNIEQGVQNRIFVNKEGDRFVDEGERRDVMTKALMEQPDGAMWVIVDKHSYPTGDTPNNFNETIDDLVALGRAYKADTLEELAELIEVDPENLVESIETFNQAVEGSAEDPFGRTLFEDKIDTAPYYAGARVPTVHHTMGGVSITEDAQVIDENGNEIEGLFAAGEVTGGIHGSNRLGGNALADVTVFGRIAGASAATSKE